MFPLAPNWIIEILSPDQSATKVTKKILHSLKFDTEMGWLIDPEEQTVFVDRSLHQVEVFEARSEQLLPVPFFASELQLDVVELFGWLLE